MHKYLLMAAVAACGALSSGCATDQPASTTEPASTTPPEPTRASTRWSSEYRTGSRLPLGDYRVGATVQPVYQFDAVEYERQRPPAGDHWQ
jgi:hypothetical protein